MAKKSEFWKQQSTSRWKENVGYMARHFIMFFILGAILFVGIMIYFRNVPLIKTPYTASFADGGNVNNHVYVSSVIYYNYSETEPKDMTGKIDPETLAALLTEASSQRKPNSSAPDARDIMWEICLSQNDRDIRITFGSNDVWNVAGKETYYRILNGDELESALNQLLLQNIY